MQIYLLPGCVQTECELVNIYSSSATELTSVGELSKIFAKIYQDPKYEHCCACVIKYIVCVYTVERVMQLNTTTYILSNANAEGLNNNELRFLCV